MLLFVILFLFYIPHTIATPAFSVEIALKSVPEIFLQLAGSLKNTVMLSLEDLNKFHYVSKSSWTNSVIVRPMVIFGEKMSLVHLNIPDRSEHPLGWDGNTWQSTAVLVQHQKQIVSQAKARLWGNDNVYYFVYCS